MEGSTKGLICLLSTLDVGLLISVSDNTVDSDFWVTVFIELASFVVWIRGTDCSPLVSFSNNSFDSNFSIIFSNELAFVDGSIKGIDCFVWAGDIGNLVSFSTGTFDSNDSIFISVGFESVGAGVLMLFSGDAFKPKASFFFSIVPSPIDSNEDTENFSWPADFGLYISTSSSVFGSNLTMQSFSNSASENNDSISFSFDLNSPIFFIEIALILDSDAGNMVSFSNTAVDADDSIFFFSDSNDPVFFFIESASIDGSSKGIDCSAWAVEAGNSGSFSSDFFGSGDSVSFLVESESFDRTNEGIGSLAGPKLAGVLIFSADSSSIFTGLIILSIGTSSDNCNGDTECSSWTEDLGLFVWLCDFESNFNLPDNDSFSKVLVEAETPLSNLSRSIFDAVICWSTFATSVFESSHSTLLKISLTLANASTGRPFSSIRGRSIEITEDEEASISEKRTFNQKHGIYFVKLALSLTITYKNRDRDGERLIDTSTLKVLGKWSLVFHNMSISSRLSIKIFDLMNAVLNITRNIICSRSTSLSKLIHSSTTSPWTWQWMSILTSSQSDCNKYKPKDKSIKDIAEDDKFLIQEPCDFTTVTRDDEATGFVTCDPAWIVKSILN